MLPAELLLEIVARSDTRTLIRSAASCKLLRHDILSPHFIRRVTQQGAIVPPCILAFLNTHAGGPDRPPPLLSLVSPATPAAAAFLDTHLSPSVSRTMDDLLREHSPLLSRGGLVVLYSRPHISSKLSNLCVYDPITGQRSFLSYPPGINPKNFFAGNFSTCIFLTAADGINCSFLLFFPTLVTRCNKESITKTVKVYIATSTTATWAPAPMSSRVSCLLFQRWCKVRFDAVILHGGVIHWLLRYSGVIVTYNVRTMEHGTINLLGHITNFKGRLYLGSHHGRKLICLLGVNGFNISVWHQLPSGDWPLEAVTINVEETLRPLDVDMSLGGSSLIVLHCAGEEGSVVLLRTYCYGPSKSLLFNLDLETMEIRVQRDSFLTSLLLEVDLSSRLRAMKVFS
ncbi:unnamed protein product [Alopecurus aequalis]